MYIQYNGGLLPDILLLTMLLPSGNSIKYREDFLSLQPMIPPKRFDNSPPYLRDAQKVWMRSIFSLKTVVIKNMITDKSKQFYEVLENKRVIRNTTVEPKFYKIGV